MNGPCIRKTDTAEHRFLVVGWMALTIFIVPTGKGQEPTVTALANSVSALGMDVVHLSAGKPDNLFFSPYSVAASFALLASGARGNTQAELLRALHSSDAASLMADVAKARDKFPSNGVTLAIGTGLWLQQDAALRPEFLALARQKYQAEIRGVDFRENAVAIRGEINTWVEEKTHGKIQDLATPEMVNPASRLVLADAIYFQGKWEKPFEKSATVPRPFFTAAGKWTSPPSMLKTNSWRYFEGQDFKALELPYADSSLSLEIILPQQVDNTAKFFAEFSEEKLQLALASLDFAWKVTVQVELPKFKIARTLDLAATFQDLGAKRAFAPTADFSGIGNQLFISSAQQKAFVSVDEDGTEAAAANIVAMTLGAVRGKQPQIFEFKIDHPFLFLIRENTSGLILFLGRIADPQR